MVKLAQMTERQRDNALKFHETAATAIEYGLIAAGIR
jgi:hypothetical protein